MVGAETAYFRRVYDRRNAFGDPVDSGNRRRVVDAFLAIQPAAKFGVDLEHLRVKMLEEGSSWQALFQVLLESRAAGQGKPYGGEKTPAHALHSGTLCDWFPDCSLIHIVRDPRDAVCSTIQMPWATRSAMFEARVWRHFNLAARQVASRGNYLLMKYENLISQPANELERVCAHIGIEYCGAMLQAAARPIDPPPTHARAYEEITPARLGLWRSRLKPWQIAIVEQTAGELMREYGYPCESAVAATGLTRLLGSAEAAMELAIRGVLRLPSSCCRYFQPTNLVGEEEWIRRASAVYGRWRSIQARSSG
jgi:hypothetical protein